MSRNMIRTIARLAACLALVVGFSLATAGCAENTASTTQAKQCSPDGKKGCDKANKADCKKKCDKAAKKAGPDGEKPCCKKNKGDKAGKPCGMKAKG